MMDTGLMGPLREVTSAMHSWEGPGGVDTRTDGESS